MSASFEKFTMTTYRRRGSPLAIIPSFALNFDLSRQVHDGDKVAITVELLPKEQARNFKCGRPRLEREAGGKR